MKPRALAVLAVVCLAAAPRARAAAGFPSKDAELHYLRGLLFEHHGLLGQAMPEYEQALKSAPGSAYLSREAAEVALELGNPDRALQWAAQVLAAQPQAAESHVLMGRVLWAKGDTGAAASSFEKALDLDASSLESVLSLSSLLASSDSDKARRLLSDFLQRNPEHASEAHFQIAKLDLQQGRTADAKAHLRKAIELEPDEALSARYALAQAYEIERSTDEALREYLDIAKLEPDNVSLLDHIGELYLAEGDAAQARASFEQAKRAQPADPSANHWLASVAEKEGRYDEAAAALRASAALPEEPTLNLRLSYDLTQAGRLKEAVGVLEQAHARWPDNDQIAYFLALGYDDLKEDDKALRLLRRVVAVKPGSHDARYQLAVILEKTGQMDESEREFRALLAAKPDDAAALNYLGYSLADRGRKLVEAEPLIEKAVSLDPRNGAYRDSLGWVHFKEGKSTEAVKELLEALELLPEDETVWDHLGDAAQARGDRRAAWRYWKRSQSLTEGVSAAGRKAQKMQRRFGAEELGRLFLQHLSLVQGGLRKLDGLCSLDGSILGRRFSYPAMFHFQSPGELRVELLGPFFAPILRLRLGTDGFLMDPIHIEGVSSDQAAAVAAGAVKALRDYLSGQIYSSTAARYRKKWWRRRGCVEADGWRLELEADAVLARAIDSSVGPVRRLVLEEFARFQGRFIPKRMSVQGRGFALSVVFNDVKVELEPAGLALSGAR